jgi:hypothetical protein
MTWHSTFNILTNEDKSLLMQAPVLVCLLVAGADDKIDKKELLGFLYHINDISHTSSLPQEFYSEMLADIENRLFDVYESLPERTEKRNSVIVKQLTQLNNILPKLEKEFALAYYKSLKDIARKIAKSSGGIIGLGAISEEEKQFVELPMIVPID